MTEKAKIKNTGATFTPMELSVFLASRIASYIGIDTQIVLDPACGEGELLIAMGERLSNSEINFFVLLESFNHPKINSGFWVLSFSDDKAIFS